MKIYIASSWKNQHAVEMLTDILEKYGQIEVVSFVRKSAKDEGRGEFGKESPDDWIWSEDGKEKFIYDTDGATNSDVVIYLGPSGTDAWAEVGAAWASKIPIFGLHAKGEQGGLMRRMISYWCSDYTKLIEYIYRYKKIKKL